MSVVAVTGSGNMLRCMLLVRPTKYNVVVVVPSLLFFLQVAAQGYKLVIVLY
jgi:hypothetical protein